MLINEVKARIENGISNCKCEVNEFSGGSDHYSVLIVSDAFKGHSMLARHRMIMDLFKDEMNTGEVHALSIKAYTFEQWEKEK